MKKENRIKLKICGMRDKNNITQVAKLKPDYLGFIFYDKSSRYYNSETIPKLPNTIKKVGVFVNMPISKILKIIKKQHLNALQLHGSETPEYCKKLKTELIDLDIEIIKVFSILNTFNFSVLNNYENYVDAFLFDTKGKLYGGNGYTFNWDALNDYKSKKPFILSGGIGLNELNKLKSFLKTEVSNQCIAIDVNSKFETSPGVKNINDLEKFKNELQH